MQQKPDAKAVHRQKDIQPSAASNDTGREDSERGSVLALISLAVASWQLGLWFYFEGWFLSAAKRHCFLHDMNLGCASQE